MIKDRKEVVSCLPSEIEIKAVFTALTSQFAGISTIPVVSPFSSGFIHSFAVFL